jgi:hypothetical protein
MTITKRYIADLSDVLAIRLLCKCAASVSIPPQDPFGIRERCPNCGTIYLSDTGMDYKHLVAFIRTLIALRQANPDAPCKVQLEFDLPES